MLDEDKVKGLQEILASSTTETKPAKVPVIMPPNLAKEPVLHRLAYQSLDTPTSIRLLKLFPLSETKDNTDLRRTLHCSIETVDLNDNPIYDALSYTWGDPLTLYSKSTDVLSPDSWASPAFEIICDGEPLSVATNLYTALISLRWIASLGKSASVSSKVVEAGITKAKYIWIDALCINQDDLTERNKQVAIMGRIYKQAQSTLVWLGGEDECFANSITAIGNLCQIKLQLADTFADASIVDEKTYERVGIPPISVSSWIDMYAFFSRSWFKRAWIVQEVALAKKVVIICGLKMMTFNPLWKALTILQRSRWVEQMRRLAEPYIEGHRSKYIFSIPLEDVKEPKRLHQTHSTVLFDHNILTKIANTRAGFGLVEDGVKLREGARSLPLSNVLSEQRFTEATDSRDKVFAFLGISREFVEDMVVTGGVQLAPDYRKSVRDVYSEATHFMLASWDSLKVLSLVQDAAETKLMDLPSWVPDFSAQGWPYAFDDGRPTPWKASEGLGQFKLRAPENYRLPVKAAQVGIIRATVELDLQKFFSLFSFVLRLPALSKINTSPMSDKLREYLLEADVEPWLPSRPSLPKTDYESGVGTLQTRFEVLWRTLLTDCFRGHHPAPSHCGQDVSIFAQHEMIKMQWEAVETYLEGDAIAWAAAKRKIRSAYTMWQAIQGRSNNVSQNTLPPEFDRAVKILDETSPQADPVAVTAALGALRDKMMSLTAEKNGARLEEVLTKIRHINSQRRLLRTDKAELGYGPFSVENGDQIWLLVGADVPFVLRPVGEGEYRLVGEAYIHGIMHGEALSRISDTNTPSDIFLV